MMNKPTTFYIVRHGQSEGNHKNIIQGHLDFTLTAKGETQARELATLLQEVTFDAVFSSDLLRAHRTAEIVVLEKKLLVQSTKLLRERHFGKFQGMDRDEFHKLFLRWEHLSDEERWHHRMEDEETPHEMITRFLTFLRETAMTYPGKTILIVCHAGLMRTLLIRLGHWEWKKIGKLDNCSFIRLESDGVDFFLKETTGIHPYEPK